MNSEKPGQLSEEQLEQLKSLLPFEFLQSYRYKSENDKMIMKQKCLELGKVRVNEFIPYDNEYPLRYNSSRKGLGVVTEMDIKARKSILTYFGEVYAPAEDITPLNYTMRLLCGLEVDAKMKGSLLRYVNHSCSPNCFIDTVWNNGEEFAVLVSEKKIAKGTELTYDYNFSIAYGEENFLCFCGTDKCRGSFGYTLPRRPVCKMTGCNAEFKSSYALYKHQLHAHIFPDGFQCRHDDCKSRKPYSSESGLYTHISKMHDKTTEGWLKLIECPSCGNKFKGPQHYLKHIEKCQID